MRKKKDSFFVRLSRSLNGFVPLFIFLALVVNLIIVYRFETTRKPQVVYSVERVLINTNTVSSVSARLTNFVSSVSVPHSSTGSVVRVSCNVNYDYFLYNGVRGVKMWDRFYNEGSLTSYGRISKIFPDRIILDDGSFIVNQKWIGGVRASDPSGVKSEHEALSPKMKRGIFYD